MINIYKYIIYRLFVQKFTQKLVRFYSKVGQILLKSWPDFTQKLVGFYSKVGRNLLKSWLDFTQKEGGFYLAINLYNQIVESIGVSSEGRIAVGQTVEAVHIQDSLLIDIGGITPSYGR